MHARPAVVLAFLAAAATVAVGRQDAPTEFRFKGSVDDEKLQTKAPPDGLIVSAKGYDALAKAWGLEAAPKADFDKSLLVVGTTRGSVLKVSAKVTDGDLRVLAISTRDLRPGFRYEIVSVPRAGVKTVNGQPLPKE